MAYVDPNFKTKKALKEAIAAGKHVTVFSPWRYPTAFMRIETIEGPHYPEPHKWYARVLVVNGIVTKVL